MSADLAFSLTVLSYAAFVLVAFLFIFRNIEAGADREGAPDEMLRGLGGIVLGHGLAFAALYLWTLAALFMNELGPSEPLPRLTSAAGGGLIALFGLGPLLIWLIQFLYAPYAVRSFRRRGLPQAAKGAALTAFLTFLPSFVIFSAFLFYMGNK